MYTFILILCFSQTYSHDLRDVCSMDEENFKCKWRGAEIYQTSMNLDVREVTFDRFFMPGTINIVNQPNVELVEINEGTAICDYVMTTRITVVNIKGQICKHLVVRMLKIENIKKSPPDTVFTNPTLKATVLEVGEIEPASGKAKAKFFAILGDETGSISCTIYKENEKPKFVKDKGVILMNVMVKQSYVAVTERTQVAMCKGFTLPQAVVESAT